MKKNNFFSVLSLIFSVIAIVLCVIIFITRGNNNESCNFTPNNTITTSDSTQSKIAYVNTDTLMLKYGLVQVLVNEMSAKKTSMNNDFNAQQQQYEKDVAYFQEQVNKGSLSEQSAQEIYQKLLNRQDELLKLQEDYNMKLVDLQQQQTKILYEKITDYINRFNKNYKYFDVVFNYSETNSAIININKSMDITDIIVEGLNSEYNAEKK